MILIAGGKMVATFDYDIMKDTKIKNKKLLAFFQKLRYSLNDIPVTPLSLRANAHFGRVFLLLETSFMGGLHARVY